MVDLQQILQDFAVINVPDGKSGVSEAGELELAQYVEVLVAEAEGVQVEVSHVMYWDWANVFAQTVDLDVGGIEYLHFIGVFEQHV